MPYQGDNFTPRERLAMAALVSKLQDCIGAAERIVHTPVPLHYVHYTSRFLSMWCFALPLCLVQSMGFLVCPLMAVVVWALFGLREIGVLIENPFRRCMQIQLVSDSIRRDVASILGPVAGSTFANPATAPSAFVAALPSADTFFSSPDKPGEWFGITIANHITANSTALDLK